MNLTVASWAIRYNWLFDLIIHHVWRLLLALYDGLWLECCTGFLFEDFTLAARHGGRCSEVNIILFILLLQSLAVKALASDDFLIIIQLARGIHCFRLRAYSLTRWYVFDPSCCWRLACCGHCSDALHSHNPFFVVFLAVWNLVGSIWGVTFRHQASGLRISLSRLQSLLLCSDIMRATFGLRHG